MRIETTTISVPGRLTVLLEHDPDLELDAAVLAEVTAAVQTTLRTALTGGPARTARTALAQQPHEQPHEQPDEQHGVAVHVADETPHVENPDVEIPDDGQDAAGAVPTAAARRAPGGALTGCAPADLPGDVPDRADVGVAGRSSEQVREQAMWLLDVEGLAEQQVCERVGVSPGQLRRWDGDRTPPSQDGRVLVAGGGRR